MLAPIRGYFKENLKGSFKARRVIELVKVVPRVFGSDVNCSRQFSFLNYRLLNGRITSGILVQSHSLQRFLKRQRKLFDI